MCRTPHSKNKEDKNTAESSTNRITTSLSLAHQSKSKQTTTTHTKKQLSIDLTLYKAYTNHWTKLRREETKMKKEFSLEDWEMETSNIVSFKKNNENAEKYCTKKGRNKKHRSPKK